MRWRDEIIFVNLWTGQFFEGVGAYDDYILSLAKIYDTDTSIFAHFIAHTFDKETSYNDTEKWRERYLEYIRSICNQVFLSFRVDEYFTDWYTKKFPKGTEYNQLNLFDKTSYLGEYLINQGYEYY